MGSLQDTMRIVLAKEAVANRYNLGYPELSDEVFYKIMKQNDLPLDSDVENYLAHDIKIRKIEKNKAWYDKVIMQNLDKNEKHLDIVFRGLIDHIIFDGDFNKSREKILFDTWAKETPEETKEDANRGKVLQILQNEIVPELFSNYVYAHAKELEMPATAMATLLDDCLSVRMAHFEEFVLTLYSDMRLLYKLDKAKSKIDEKHRTRQPIYETEAPKPVPKVQRNKYDFEDEDFCASAERVF